MIEGKRKREKLLALLRFLMPKTKQMASRILDLPDPLRPVMALNSASHPVM